MKLSIKHSKILQAKEQCFYSLNTARRLNQAENWFKLFSDMVFYCFNAGLEGSSRMGYNTNKTFWCVDLFIGYWDNEISKDNNCLCSTHIQVNQFDSTQLNRKATKETLERFFSQLEEMFMTAAFWEPEDYLLPER